MLTARYLGWAQGTPSREAVVGPAAERVLHASLREAAPEVGYRLANPVGGAASRFLGMPVPIGPLDNAAVVATVTAADLPGPAVALPIEVKNLRDWLYPTSSEVYQLLSKAALLQQALPNVRIMPLLVARRIHVTTFRMFKDLGAYGVQTKRQYIGTVDAERLQEVRIGLGFLDLQHRPSGDPLIVSRLTRPIPRDAARVSLDWAETCADPTLIKVFQQLRAESRITARSALVSQLRAALSAADRYNGGW